MLVPRMAAQRAAYWVGCSVALMVEPMAEEKVFLLADYWVAMMVAWLVDQMVAW